MCWRLLCVIDKKVNISSLRYLAILPANDVIIEHNDVFACYEICEGLCACSLVPTDYTELDRITLEQQLKRLQRKGLKPEAINKRLETKKRNLQHKRNINAGDQKHIVDIWLRQQNSDCYLFLYWQDRNQAVIKFQPSEEVISTIIHIPENSWVKYQRQ